MSNFQGDNGLERLANDAMEEWGDEFDPEAVENNIMEEEMRRSMMDEEWDEEIEMILDSERDGYY
jgi:hypothetical protein